MSEQNKSKLNQLQRLLEEGFLAPTHWLEAQGYSRALLSGYVKSGWLVSPARGVYRRPGPPLKWQHVVLSLQLLGESYFHVGGLTALVHRGLGHYLQMSGPETIMLYGPETLPAWVNQLGLEERFVVRQDAMFHTLRARRDAAGAPVDGDGKPLAIGQMAELGLQQMSWGAWDRPLWYASNERAILEFLQDVPAKASVYEADALMQGLASLRPTRVTELLRECQSVKVKRLFLALADRHQHAWLKHVDLQGVDLGAGKRMLVRGGKLHAKYQITLPADLDGYTQ